ncbi:MAG: UDP-glucose 4-epimerase GalE, partial [Variibacter sp.]
MTILITGGAGFIGSHMALRLRDEGEDVVVIDNLRTGFAWAVPDGVELIIGDIGDRGLVESTIQRRRINAIIHFAGSVVVSESVADPLGYYLNNTIKSRDLIACATATGVPHFIFSSTAAVYGDTDSVAISEDAPTRPASPYGTSKLMTEMMLRDAAAAHPFTYTALRYFNVAGADPQTRTGQATRGATHLVKVACEAALGIRPVLEIFGTDYPTADGTCVRDYIHVWDLVAAHSLALRRLRSGGGNLVANCGYGKGYSVRQVVDAVRQVSGCSFEVSTRERRPGDVASVVADPAVARAQLGWKPQFDNI